MNYALFMYSFSNRDVDGYMTNKEGLVRRVTFRVRTRYLMDLN